jgi:hypothetical protein
MCGIAAYSGPKDSLLNEDKLKLLLYMNQERGKDSLGFYTRELGVVKKLGLPENIMSNKEFKIEGKGMFIGHVRAATSGAKTEKNSHPFEHGNIVLVMNGTLTNHWDLCRENDLKPVDFDVDSDVLTALINKYQSKTPLTKIKGGCAIVYTDKNTGKMYCYRNSDRPLYRGKFEDSMYISSTDISLKLIGCTDVKEFKENFLYEIEDGHVVNQWMVKRNTEVASLTGPRKLGNNSFIYVDGFKYHNLVMFQIPVESLVGHSILCNYNVTDGNPFANEITEGYGYLVVGTAKESTCIKVIGNTGAKIDVPRTYFSGRIGIIEKDSYVFTKYELSYEKKGKTKELFAPKGALCKVNYITNSDSFNITDIMTNKVGAVDADSIYFAYPKDISLYKEINGLDQSKKEEKPILQIPQNNQISVFKQNDFSFGIMNPSRKSITTYKEEVLKTDVNDLLELGDFTVNSIDEIMDDIRELFPQSFILQQHLEKINILKENWMLKSIFYTAPSEKNQIKNE